MSSIISDLKKEKETAENISKKYTTENETLSQQLKEKEEELLKQKEALTTQYEDKKALNDSLKESNKSLKEEIERLKNENKTLSLNIDQLNQSQSEFDVKLQGKESVITDLTKESFDKDNLIQKLNEQVAKLKNDIKEAEESWKIKEENSLAVIEEKYKLQAQQLLLNEQLKHNQELTDAIKEKQKEIDEYQKLLLKANNIVM